MAKKMVENLKINAYSYVLFFAVAEILRFFRYLGLFEFLDNSYTIFTMQISGFVFMYKTLKSFSFLKNNLIRNLKILIFLYIAFSIIAAMVFISEQPNIWLCVIVIILPFLGFFVFYKIYDEISKISSVLDFKYFSVFYAIISLTAIFMDKNYILFITLKAILFLYLIFAWNKFFKTISV